MSEFKNMEELRAVVEQAPVSVVTLEELRESLGYRKLGGRVLEEIRLKLAGQGLGYFPRNILDANDSPRGYEEVRVYKKDSGVGKVIEHVLEPTESGDTFLVELAQPDNSAAEMLDSIRRIIGE